MSLLSSMQPVTRTTSEMTAVSAILASVLNVLPTILGIVAGTMGIIWYCVLFYDRFILKGPDADKEKGAGG